MPFDGSGNFVPLSLPDFPAIGGQPIYATQFNNVINDLIGGLSSVMARSGETPMTGDLQMGGNRIKGVAAAAASGDVLTFGANATVADLSVTGALGVVGNLQTAGNVVALRSGAVATKGEFGVTSVGSALIGYNNSGGLSPISTPSGAAFIGSAQSVALSFGLGGAERARLDANGTWNTTGGYACGGGITAIGTVTAPTFSGNATSATYATSAGSASAVPWTGVSGRPTALSQFTNDIGAGAAPVTSVFGRTGAVTLTSGDVTGALGYTPLSGVNSSQIVSALGYTPYNGATNPSGFISGINAFMVTSALGGTPVLSISVTDTYEGSNLGYGKFMTDCVFSKSGSVLNIHRYFMWAAASGGGSAGGD